MIPERPASLRPGPGPAVPHTFIVWVEDRPGVLNRIVTLFRRRAYNIDSLTVGRTEKKGVSRITLVARADNHTARHLEANLYKIVDVLAVEDVTGQPAVVREMAFVKMGGKHRTEVMQLCEVFRARVVDLAPGAVTIEGTGSPAKIDGLIEALRPYGILELVRTGAVAITRGLTEQAPASQPALDKAG
jgi:acetolactate synthase I/III small subunit